MDVHKFEAFSMQDAILQVRKKLGNDAIIISTKEVEKKFDNSQTTKKVVEILASSPKLNGTKPNAYFHKTRPYENPQPYIFPSLQKDNGVTIVSGNTQEKTPENRRSHTLNHSLMPPIKTNPNIPKNRETEPLVDALVLELNKFRKELKALPSLRFSEQIDELKVLLFDLVRDKYKTEDKNIPPTLIDIYVKLKVANVNESLITHVIDHLHQQLPQKDQDPKEFYLSQAIGFLFQHMTISKPEQDFTQRICCFVGPAGVGKTSFIAKIAAQKHVLEKKTVCLLSFDNVRLTGSDQLRVYARVLNVPFYQIDDPATLPDAVSRIKEDLIFIDTAAFSPKFIAHNAFFQTLNQLPVPIAFHLVLSAAMKQRDLDEIIKTLNFLNIQSLVFTKLDESFSFGEILNCNIKNGIPLSHFSIGQHIPEDLEKASKERVIERIFHI